MTRAVLAILIVGACSAPTRPEPRRAEPPPPAPWAPPLAALPPLPGSGAPSATPLSDWQGYDAAEATLLAGINELRATGAFCGERGYFGPVEPLSPDRDLHRAARAHSHDMAGRRYVGHVDPDGNNYVDRAERAGYRGWIVGETLAAHLRDPRAVLFGFRLSDGHCAVLMAPDFADAGVGFYPGGTGYWTVLLGAPNPVTVSR